MNHYYWNDWYAGWGWFLWIGVWFLLISSFGNWGYTYVAHRKFDEYPRKQALDILDERYARGEINRQEYGQMKMEISGKSARPEAANRNRGAGAKVEART